MDKIKKPVSRWTVQRNIRGAVKENLQDIEPITVRPTRNLLEVFRNPSITALSNNDTYPRPDASNDFSSIEECFNNSINDDASLSSDSSFETSSNDIDTEVELFLQSLSMESSSDSNIDSNITEDWLIYPENSSNIPTTPVTSDKTIVNNLKEWAVVHNITLSALRGMLEILQKTIPTLPRDSHTF